jgi:putative ABC transport system permease protein
MTPLRWYRLLLRAYPPAFRARFRLARRFRQRRFLHDAVLSETVQRRAREVGIRMTLGATPGSIVHLILTQTTRLAACGIAIGLAGAVSLSDLLTTQLYDISPRDPLTIGATALALAIVALLAAWLPTRRATSVDLMITLRAQ